VKFIRPYLVQAYLVCPREAWLEYHALHADQEHELLALGRLVHETSYKRLRKEIFVDRLLKIDLFREGLVAEVKRSSRRDDTAELQLAYYLYYLKHQKGLDMEGILLFPKEKRTRKVRLTPEIEEKISRLLAEMRKLFSRREPPPPQRIKECRSCAFEEVCWA